MNGGNGEASGLMQFAEFFLGREYKLYPFQRDILDMIDSLPEGAEIKVNLRSNGTSRMLAVKDGVAYFYSGNRNWVPVK